MSAKRDYYEVLGCSKGATDEELKKAYRKLSMQLHPDRQNGKSDAEKKEAEEKFKEVNEAYAVLSDKDKRAQYDQFGFDGPGFDNGPHGFDPFSFFHKMNGGFGPFGFEEGFEEDHDPWANSFSSRKANKDMPRPGRNVQIEMTISFAEAVFGVNKEFDISANSYCSHCNGTGAENGDVINCPTCHGSGIMSVTQRRGMMSFTQTTTCPHCRGEGFVAVKTCSHCHGRKTENIKKHINVNIPAGVSNGTKLLVHGKGCEGLNGGKTGDLIILLFVKENKLFQQVNQPKPDLSTKLYLSPVVATLGGKATCMTPYGECEISIPAGTSTGKVFRLAGKGIKTRTMTGDLYAEVFVQPFVNLDSDQKKLLEKLSKSLTDRNIKDLTEQQNDFSKFRDEVEKI